jgi:curved DNA-binding protein CbpA
MKSLLVLLLLVCVNQIAAIKFNFHQQSPKINFDPYATLSLRPSATPTQIQKAYRTKARETHPDKNPSPNANEEFRLVSEAFEILSDPQKKRAHDEQRRRERMMQEEQKKREERRRQAEQRERERELMRKREMIQRARAGYDRVLRWSHLSQLEEMTIDHSINVYSTNLLLMFVGNKASERKGEEDYFFPYPFVGDDGSSISNDVLLVAKVRLNH